MNFELANNQLECLREIIELIISTMNTDMRLCPSGFGFRLQSLKFFIANHWFQNN